MRFIRVGVGALAFLSFTALAFTYQVRHVPPGAVSPHFAALQWKYGLALVLLLPVETLASALRTRLVALRLHPGLRLWACVKAECANVGMNLITPAHTGGGPAQVYLLAREGVPAGTALTIALLGFLGTMTALSCMAVYGWASRSPAAIGAQFRVSLGAMSAVVAAMTVAAVWPGPDPSRHRGISRRLLEFTHRYHRDIRAYARRGSAGFAPVLALSAAFIVARIALAFVSLRFLGLTAPAFGEVAERQLTLIFVLFFAPTPGGAGIAEGASLVAMGGLVPAGYAPFYTMLWRFSTAYAAAIAGLLWLGHALVQDARTKIDSRRDGAIVLSHVARDHEHG